MIAATIVSAGLVGSTSAAAQGPQYPGPNTTATGPAYFGPAPNPVAYCESPTYFDPFPENINPVGRLDVGDTASVTTDGITMEFRVTGEGDPGGQYPGFFPAGGEGAPNDQPKGVEMASDDAATVSLTEPLFYSQWVFTDVDRANEGFFVTPTWTAPGGQMAVFAGHPEYEFSGTGTEVLFNDSDAQGHDSEDIQARVQVDMLGAVTGIQMLRDTGSGQSGFAVGGGCEAAGAAKEVVAGPTWNGEAFEVTYALRVRNNLPSAATLAAAILAAQNRAPSEFLTGDPAGITLSNLQLTDNLADTAFSDITVTDITSPDGSLPVNAGYDGLADTDLLAAGASLDAESEGYVTIDVAYTPDLATGDWDDCAAGYDYSNQSVVNASAANVDVTDQSDDGDDPAPGANNGVGGVDDPTLVNFDCPPAEVQIVKTVVDGPNGTCPSFDEGVPGDGPTHRVDDGDTVTYCISIHNPGAYTASNVTISDPQNPDGDIDLGNLAGGGYETISYDLAVDLDTPTTNTATVSANGPDGALPPASDTAVIGVDALSDPNVEIVKAVYEGPNSTCPAFPGNAPGVGTALPVNWGETVTYCVVVRNLGPGIAYNVVVTDPQASGDFGGAIGELDVGENVTLSYDVVVDENTPALNTATVDSTNIYGDEFQDSDDALINPIRPLDPRLQIVKTVVPGPDGTCPTFLNGVIGSGTPLQVSYGQTVTYCITVQNGAGNDATNVVITDDQAPASFDGIVGDLAVGSEVTRSYDIVVDANTPESNTATVNGDGPNGPVTPDSDDAVIDSDPEADPQLEIRKTVVPGPNGNCPSFADAQPGAGAALNVQHGETVTYCLVVRNISGTDATNVVVADPQAPASFDGNIGNLAVGNEANRSFDLVVDENTESLNTATVNGNGPNGPLPETSDQAIIDPEPLPDPQLRVRKTAVAGPGGLCPNFDSATDGIGDPLKLTYGDTMTYCIAVKNISGSDATDVVVSDAQAPAGFDGNVGDLAVDQEAYRMYDLVVTTATETINVAAVGGRGPNGPVPDDTDNAIIDPDQPGDARLAIVKTVVEGPNGDCPVFANGDFGSGVPLPAVIDQDTVTYCITVTNTGSGTATGVVLTDPQAPAGFDGNVGTLASGAEETRSYDIAVTASTPEVNVATANGTGPLGALESVTDDALIRRQLQPDPDLQVIKTVVSGPNGSCPSFDNGIQGPGTPLAVTVGNTVTYCISVANLGDSPATNVVLSDAQAPASFDGNIGTLNPGGEATRSYDLVVTATTEQTNTALVSGTGPNGVLTDEDTAQIRISDQPQPNLDLVKTVIEGPDGDCPSHANGQPGAGDPLGVRVGDVVTYCLSIQNVGAGDATDVVVTDDQAPAGFDGNIGTIIAGGEASLSFDVTVASDTPERNIATVTGKGPDGDLPEVTDEALIDIDQRKAVLEVVKTAVPGPDGNCPTFDLGTPGPGDALDITIGDVVTYCLSVRNTGDGEATNVVINDQQADAPFAIGTLGPGATADRQYDVTVAADTPPLNTAVATGIGPDGNPVDPAEDTSLINPTDQPVPRVEITNTVIAKGGDCDDTVESEDEFVLGATDDEVVWCFVITNTGNTALTDVSFTNTPLGISDVDVLADYGNGAASLGAGESISFPIDGTIPEVGLTSMAEVEAQPSDAAGNPLPEFIGQPVSDTNDAAVAETDITFVKTVLDDTDGDCADGVESVTVDAGSEVRWCFTVTNTGGVDVKVTEVRDSVLDVVIAVPADQQILKPGDSVTVSTVTTVDDDLINQAEATGVPVNPEGQEYPDSEVTDEDESEVVARKADLSITKSVNDTSVSRGQELSYGLVVRNLGPSAAEGVKVTDTLPVGLTYVSEPDLDGWTCSTAEDGRSMTCEAADPMAADTSATLIYRVDVDDDADRGQAMTNTATVESDTPDPNEDNNTDRETVNIPVPQPVIGVPLPSAPTPTPTPEPEDEVLELVVTGAESDSLVTVSLGLLLAGSAFAIAGRRRRDS